MNLNLLVTATAEQESLKQLVIQGRVPDRDLSFSTSLVQARKPSASQMYWVGKMIESATAVTQPVVATAAKALNPAWTPEPLIKIDVSKIVSMFENARKHLKFPKVTLLMDVKNLKSGVRFSFDRKGRNLLWANEAVSYGVTYASINLDTGVVDLRRHGLNRKTEFLALVDEFSKTPIQMAILHGKLTGNCCFCSLPLTDERSLQCGYGDTCARHYRLPWGKQNNFTAIGDWAMNGTKVEPKPNMITYQATTAQLLEYISRKNDINKVFSNKPMDPNALTEEDIKSIREDLETDLSPENLTCDGELSGAPLRAKKAYLTAAQSELFDLIAGV
jgi:hypothetical protein